MKVLLGYDPLEGDTRPKGEKQPGLARSEAREVPSLQDLRQRIYAKAKAEPSWRFWGLYVHVSKMETLQEAYRMAKANNGAPGIDGVTFEAIEAHGVPPFLEEIRDELITRTYRPMRNRKKEIPKSGGRVRTLGIPSIRDRVVQGALKLILEPIFETDFQEGSFGYRPDRSAHQAVQRVAEAIVRGKTQVIDLDLRAYFDNVRHHVLLAKVAERVRDDDVLRLLKMILKASGKKGVPQGGVISPLMSNVYLNEVDRMLERAKTATRQGRRMYLEYARYADDVIVLVDPKHPRGDWLRKAVGRRLREELVKLQVEINEEKTRNVDLAAGENFDFLGFRFQRRRSQRGKWWPCYEPVPAKRTELVRKLKEIFRRYRSQPVARVIEIINPILRGWVNYFRMGHARRCFAYVRLWVEKKIRRHLMRSRGRRGFGWKRWSTPWLHANLGLFRGYKTVRLQPRAKALPCT
ncbi:MAG: group II intron reverse transcriptase/maturase [Candidatus Thermoplasmatota archaeon]|nr:group II intron reverse transcriptase/maturase [Candidatus Thermoplasmatota archaeon]